MGTVLKAVRYRNLDEAREVLRGFASPDEVEEIFDDGGDEPQGLLAVVSEDLVPEEVFYQLFDTGKGVLVEVERIGYSGYGPPAEEQDYMGFVTRQTAYVMLGCRYRIEISNCPQGARDIHHLEALVLDHKHPLNRPDLSRRLELSENWDFEDLLDLVISGRYTAEQLDRLIHQGIQ